MDDNERQQRILDHPLSAILLPSLIATAGADPSYRHTVYVGFDSSDPLFDDALARRALDARLQALLDAQTPRVALSILFVPLSTGPSLTLKLNSLARLAYVDDPARARTGFSFSPDAATAARADTASSRTELPHARHSLFVLARPQSQFVTPDWAAVAAQAFTKNALFPGMGVLGFTDPTSAAFPLALAVTSVHLSLFDGDLFQLPSLRFAGTADGWLYSIYKPWGAAQDLPVHTRTQLFLDAQPLAKKTVVDMSRPEAPAVDPDVYLQLSLPKGQIKDLRQPVNIATVKSQLSRQIIKGRKRLNMIFNGYYYDSKYDGLVDERDLNAMSEAKKYYKINMLDSEDPKAKELLKTLPPGSYFGLGRAITAKSTRLINVFDGCVLVEHRCKLSVEQGKQHRSKQDLYNVKTV
jgi:hypothetical protein